MHLFEYAENILCPFDGEGGDQHVSPVEQRLPDRLFELGDTLLHGAVVPVTVGGLDHQMVRLPRILHVGHHYGPAVAQISAEDDFAFPTALFVTDLQKGRAQDMAGVAVAHPNPFGHVDSFAVLGVYRGEQPDVLHILHRVEGRRDPFFLSASLSLFVEGPVLLLHQLGRIQQHHIGDLEGRTGGDDGPPKALLDQFGDPAHVVQVGVGDQQHVDLPGVEPEGFIVASLLFSLKHTAVDHHVDPVFQSENMAGARHDPVGPVGLKRGHFSSFLSEVLSLSFYYREIYYSTN
jgi:hypothetical protein